MSVQENYLKGIADALRDRFSTRALIAAESFAAHIRALPAAAVKTFQVDPSGATKAINPMKTYNFASGTTFIEWAKSDYNTDGYDADPDRVSTTDVSANTRTYLLKPGTSTYVKGTDVIQALATYGTKTVAGEGRG